jgi:hypothetical protein
MRRILYFLAGTMLVLSCSKETSVENGQRLIAKIVTKSGTDSTVIEYSFDSRSRFAQEKTTSGTDVSTLSLVRDASGRATRMVQSAMGSMPATVVTDYIYLSAGDSRLRNGILKTDVQGLAVNDSIAFTYATRVSRTTHYFSAVGIPSLTAYYLEYSYDARGNMTQAKVYQATGLTTVELAATLSFEYDNNPSPVYFKDDVLVENLTTQFLSPNNVTKVSLVAADPTDNFTATTVYEYRSDGRPSRATRTVSGVSFVSDYTYR